MRPRFYPRFLAIAVGAAAMGLLQGPRSAKGARPNVSPSSAGGAEGSLSAASLAKLKSPDLDVVRAGLDDARLVGKKAAPAVPLIDGLLRAGLPYAMAEAALDTLGDLEPPDAAPVLALYARHRDVKVRLAAIRALGKADESRPPEKVSANVAANTHDRTHDRVPPVAVATLRAALSDPDGGVRGAAATGLGALRATVAVDDLFLALDHKVFEAAASIGQLCAVAECEAFAGRLGKLPFDVMTTGLDPILFRPSSDISDDVKVALVTKIRDVGTRDVNRFLTDVARRWPKLQRKSALPAVKQAIDAAVMATISSPGGQK